MTKTGLHIAVDKTDRKAYSGTFVDLEACVADARAVENLAKARGFTTERLHDSKATAEAVLAKLGELAERLVADDVLFLSYSGHGSQVPGSADASEVDTLDETWVLHDRQLLDDEIFQALAAFARGVRIFVISDSCNSGTALRLDRGLQTAATEPVAPPGTRQRWFPWSARKKDFDERRDLYESVRAGLDPQVTDIAASVIYFAACQDGQSALEKDGQGCFTRAFLSGAKSGAPGSYAALFGYIAAEMSDLVQVPNYVPMGSDDFKYDQSEPLT
jgi:hypothetical protein